MQIDEAREFIKFLHGAVPWNGTWFGEYAPGDKGAYWWRKHLDEAIAALIAAPATLQQADAEMIRTEAWQSIADERAHAAYLRGIEEGKRQATTPQDRSAPARRNDMAAFATELKADPAKAQAFFQSAGIIDERGELMPEYAAPQRAEPVAWMFDRRYGSGLSFGRPADYENEDGDTISPTPLYRRPPAAPQQAEPVAQIGWADEFGNLFPMGAWKPTQRTHHDSHKTAWRAVYLHPPAEPQQAEPVAWAVFDPSGEAIYAALFKTRCVEYVDNEYRYGHGAAKHWAVRPVFAHPPAAEVQRLRDAAKRVTAAQSGSAFAINESINALRSALERGE